MLAHRHRRDAEHPGQLAGCLGSAGLQKVKDAVACPSRVLWSTRRHGATL
jgi:hypothetical protein